MKKETAVAKAEFGIENFPKSVTDPETGLKIKVTHDMVAALVSAERQITSGAEQIAMALHRIRREKLYLLYDLGSMSEYLEKRFAFTERFGYYLLKMADVFGDSKHFADIMRQPRKLLEIAAKDEGLTKQFRDGEITLSNGTVTTLAALKKEITTEIVKDYEKTKKKNTQLENDLDEARKELKDTKVVIRNYEKRADVPDKYFQTITAKAAALTEILAIEAEAADMMARLAAIESEEPTVVSKLAGVLSMVLAGFSQVQSKYMHLILEVAPEKKV